MGACTISNGMDTVSQDKLIAILKSRLEKIDKELSVIASENPLAKGDFEVTVEDLGKSEEDTEQEAGELDRNQAMVNVLEKERKEIENTLKKIESGTYGKDSA
jgi:RNA polymerase-binding transcription factor DksA